jgi:hypothetical protein
MPRASGPNGAGCAQLMGCASGALRRKAHRTSGAPRRKAHCASGAKKNSRLLFLATEGGFWELKSGAEREERKGRKERGGKRGEKEERKRRKRRGETSWVKAPTPRIPTLAAALIAHFSISNSHAARRGGLAEFIARRGRAPACGGEPAPGKSTMESSLRGQIYALWQNFTSHLFHHIPILPPPLPLSTSLTPLRDHPPPAPLATLYTAHPTKSGHTLAISGFIPTSNLTQYLFPPAGGL